MALLLTAEKLRVAFGPRTLFEIPSIEIHDGDRIGLIGENGAGKSTLFSVLHGEIQPDGGKVTRFCQSAIIRQFGDPEDAEVDPALRARLRAKSAAHPGISGGELSRLRAARALSLRAPLLFVDEPTTHLDFEGVAQVQKALAAHRGALLLISHDRALLDALCQQIWALSEGALCVYPGNYSAYRQQKELALQSRRFQYDQYRSEQKRLRAAMRELSRASSQVQKAPSRMGNSEARLHKRGKGTTARKKLDSAASSLQSRLDGMKEVERPREEARIRMGLSQRDGVVSATAIHARGVSLSAGGKTLLRDASFSLPKGKRTVLVGPNGCGKTTLLRAIRDEAPGILQSPGVSIGWFGQETADTLDPSLSLLENVRVGSALAPSAIRTMLSRVGLSARDMEKPVSILSGGERAKTALARLMAGSATLLLLDEPSNHLDIGALEALEEMLSSFEGTLLMVCHDRRMIDRVAHRLLLFENEALVSFDGNLSAYESRRVDAAAQNRALQADILRMRMSALLSRMSAPHKGDRPNALAAEYDEMAKQLREMET